jgi:hypothetical protein
MGEDPELPSYVGLLSPTLAAVRELGGSAVIRHIDAKAIDLGGFSAAQRARMHGDGRSTELEYRLAWARTALKGMGALENPARGIWRTTARSVATCHLTRSPGGSPSISLTWPQHAGRKPQSTERPARLHLRRTRPPTIPPVTRPPS